MYITTQQQKILSALSIFFDTKSTNKCLLIHGPSGTGKRSCICHSINQRKMSHSVLLFENYDQILNLANHGWKKNIFEKNGNQYKFIVIFSAHELVDFDRILSDLVKMKKIKIVITSNNNHYKTVSKLKESIQFESFFLNYQPTYEIKRILQDISKKTKKKKEIKTLIDNISNCSNGDIRKAINQFKMGISTQGVNIQKKSVKQIMQDWIRCIYSKSENSKNCSTIQMINMIMSIFCSHPLIQIESCSSIWDTLSFYSLYHEKKFLEFVYKFVISIFSKEYEKYNIRKCIGCNSLTFTIITKKKRRLSICNCPNKFHSVTREVVFWQQKPLKRKRKDIIPIKCKKCLKEFVSKQAVLKHCCDKTYSRDLFSFFSKSDLIVFNSQFTGSILNNENSFNNMMTLNTNFKNQYTFQNKKNMHQDTKKRILEKVLCKNTHLSDSGSLYTMNLIKMKCKYDNSFKTMFNSSEKRFMRYCL